MIRQGIMPVGYVAIFIDEVEHNEFEAIEKEDFNEYLISQFPWLQIRNVYTDMAIKDSKFTVVYLSHQNNGAYLKKVRDGLGKPVIQLCKKDVRLYFDIAQENTIIREIEEEIPEA